MARETKCTTVGGVWEGIGLGNIATGILALIGLITVGVWAALAAFGAASLTPASMAVAAWGLAMACVLGINMLTKLRSYFFDFRLICLGPDRCALAHVISIEDNDDGDRSMNTILAPANESTSFDDYRMMYQASELVFKDPGLAARGFHLDPLDVRKPPFGRFGLPFLHCEIEGTYMDDWTTALLAYLWTLLALAAAAFAAAAAALALGPIGWALWIAIAFFLFLAALFGFHFWPGPEHDDIESTPSPGGPVITDVEGNSINLGDFLIILGRPVCDTGHNPKCWDELHPVRAVSKIPESDYTSAPSDASGDVHDRYCKALHDWIDDIGKIERGLTATQPDGQPKLACLEHPAIG